MLNFLKKVAFLLLGSFLMIGGLFMTIAGALGGFGASSVGLRIAYALAGIIIFLLGLYLYYRGSNKNILKVVGDIIDAIIFNI